MSPTQGCPEGALYPIYGDLRGGQGQGPALEAGQHVAGVTKAALGARWKSPTVPALQLNCGHTQFASRLVGGLVSEQTPSSDDVLGGGSLPSTVLAQQEGSWARAPVLPGQ